MQINTIFDGSFDAILINDDITRRYLTGFSSSAGMVLITPNKSYFLTDFRYIEEAKKVIKGFEVLLVSGNRTYTVILKELLTILGIKKLGIEEERITLTKFRQWQFEFSSVQLVSCDKELAEIRRTKTSVQLNYIKKAQEISEKAFDEVLNFIKIGKTEHEIASFLIYNMLNFGAEKMSFDPIVVSGANSSKPHGVPSDKAVEAGDFITMDFGSIYGGFCSDMTRTIAVGHVTDEMAEVYDIVLEAQMKGIEKASASVPASEVDIAARKVITARGFGDYFGHGFGHGIGAEVHEAPSVSYRSTDILRECDVISAEPGIYLPDKFGVRIEDMLYITADGSENLTKSQKKLIIL